MMSKQIIYINNSQLLNGLQSIVEVKTNLVPLYEIGQQLKDAADVVSDNLDKVMKNNNTNLDNAAQFEQYMAIFEKYTAFCQLTKDSMQAFQQTTIPGIRIDKSKLDRLFAHSLFVGQRREPLAKAEFEQLKGVDLQIYWLTFQVDFINGVYQLLSFLSDNISSDGLPLFFSYQILVSPHKPAIFLGEEYKAEIRLAPYYEKPTNFTLQINGDSLAICADKAVYTHHPTKVGEQSYRAIAVYKDPVTGELIKVSQEFRYEVLPAKAKK